MGGAGKPGATFKGTVKAVGPDTFLVSADPEDVKHLKVDTEYVFHVIESGDEPDKAQSA